MMLIKSRHLKKQKVFVSVLQKSRYTCGFILLCLIPLSHAENISYAQAEQYLVENSYVTQANTALAQASQLQADAVKNIGLPRIDLNVRAYKFHAETDLEKKEQELGDVLFSVVNYARILGMNPDSALEKTNAKFISRFQKMEKLALERNLNLSEMSLKEMDLLWEEAKRIGN